MRLAQQLPLAQLVRVGQQREEGPRQDAGGVVEAVEPLGRLALEALHDLVGVVPVDRRFRFDSHWRIRLPGGAGGRHVSVSKATGWLFRRPGVRPLARNRPRFWPPGRRPHREERGRTDGVDVGGGLQGEPPRRTDGVLPGRAGGRRHDAPRHRRRRSSTRQSTTRWRTTRRSAPLAVVDGPEGPYSRYYHIPRTADDLLQRSALIERATALGGTLVILIKEIGTDALFALRLVAEHLDRTRGTAYLPRVERFPRVLPRPRPGRCRGPDRRQGRPEPGPDGAGPSRLLRPGGRRGRGRHHAAGREGPHVGLDQRPRDHRPADPQPEAGRGGLRGGVRGAGQRAGPDDAGQRLRRPQGHGRSSSRSARATR